MVNYHIHLTKEQIRKKIVDDLKKDLIEAGTPKQLTLAQSLSRSRNKINYVFDIDCPYKEVKNGRVMRPHWIWWKTHPNEPIKYNDEIHHINGNHQDDRPENLIKLTKKQHKLAHKILNQMLKEQNKKDGPVV